MKHISIAIDGPAGAGKSTIAKKISQIKKLTYIDTGAMYRAVTLKLLRNNVSFDDINTIEKLLNKTKIELTNDNIFLDNVNVKEDIRTPEVTKNVSEVAAIPIVREKMVKLQREVAFNNDVIMDGRDIGTKVLEKATHKFFLTATIKERAVRRHMELINKGYSYNIEEVIDEITQRDKIDSERTTDPLRVADDAIIIDTSGKTIDQVIDMILNLIM